MAHRYTFIADENTPQHVLFEIVSQETDKLAQTLRDLFDGRNRGVILAAIASAFAHDVEPHEFNDVLSDLIGILKQAHEDALEANEPEQFDTCCDRASPEGPQEGPRATHPMEDALGEILSRALKARRAP